MNLRLTFLGISLFIFTLTQAQKNFDIYVSDAGNFDKPPWQIIKFDSAGLNPEVFIKDSLDWPQDILFLEEKREVLISNLGSGKICRHHAETGEYLGDFALGIGGPTRMLIGPDSLLYVLQWLDDWKVQRYSLNTGKKVGESDSGVVASIGICWDVSGNSYVTSYKESTVTRFDKNGKFSKVLIDTNIKGPTNIWFDADKEELCILNYSGGGISRFNLNGEFIDTLAMNDLKQCEGVAFLPDGNVLIGNGTTKSVRLFNGKLEFQRDLVAPNTAGLLNPNAVVIRYKN